MRAQSSIAVFPLALSLACTEFEPGTDELPDPFQSTLAAAPGADWSCLGRNNPAASVVPMVDRARPLNYTLRVVDYVTRVGPAGLMARACNLADLECLNPVTPYVASDDGTVSIGLFHGFLGYFELLSPATIPGVILQDRTLTAATEPLPFPYYLVPPEAFQSLVQAIGVVPDLEAGYLGVYTLDCAGNIAGGVHVELVGVETSVAYYFANGLPTTQLDETGPDGIAGFLNAPPGTVLLRATVQATGQVVNTRLLTIRKGWQSATVVAP